MRSLRLGRWTSGILAGVIAAVIFAGGWIMLRPHGTSRQATLGGFLLGAGVVAALNQLSSWHQGELAAKASRARSLDETRRLRYAAYFGSDRGADHDSWELGGTVANAVAHQWRTKTMEDALALGDRVTKGRMNPGEFVEVVTLISEELGDEAPERSIHLDLGAAPLGP